MLTRTVDNPWRYLFAFIIGTGIFLFFLFLSYLFAYFEFQRGLTLQSQASYSLFEHKLLSTHFSHDPCASPSISEVFSSLNYQRTILGNLEEKLGKESPVVLERKRFYSLLLLEHFFFVESLNAQCNGSIQMVVFFYSNNESLVESSLLAGNTLDLIPSLVTDKVYVYSFEADLDSPLVQAFYSRFNRLSTPSVVVNGNATLLWPFTVQDVVRLMHVDSTP